MSATISDASGVRWIRTRTWTVFRVTVVGMLVGWSAFVGVVSIGILRQGFLWLTVGFIVAWIASAIGFVLLTLWLQPTSVGLSPTGVIFLRLGRKNEVPWSYVAPAFLERSRWRFIVHFSQPGKKGTPQTVLLQREQGQAIVNHPWAPKWVMPPEAREKWDYHQL